MFGVYGVNSSSAEVRAKEGRVPLRASSLTGRETENQERLLIQPMTAAARSKCSQQGKRPRNRGRVIDYSVPIMSILGNARIRARRAQACLPLGKQQYQWARNFGRGTKTQSPASGHSAGSEIRRSASPSQRIGKGGCNAKANMV
jgi:hypothetical protein